MTKSGKYDQTISGHVFSTRLDIDGNYPQNKVSISIGNTYPALWIADLASTGNNEWEGDIWYTKDNAAALKVNADGQLSGAGDTPDKIHVKYEGYYASGDFYYVYVTLKNSATGAYWKYWFKQISEHFREVEVEMDYEAGVNAITSLNPHDVDNHRPASIPNANITVDSTYLKAGIKITNNAAGAVATAGAGANSKWSNNELHDAMQTQWSKNEAAQWAMWVFQADKHEDDHSGIMFDSIGNFQRCGTALFHGQSGYTGAPAGVVNRHKFITLIHEMGHSFNLYHSWIKTSGASRWSNRVTNEAEARSYMNYPDRVAAGYYGFFDTFDYRFSDQELLFLRHGPESFVQPGGSAWGTNHSGAEAAGSGLTTDFNQAEGGPADERLQLTVRCNKAVPVYEYLEFVNVELKLKNVSDQPVDVVKDMLEDLAHMNVKVVRNRETVKTFKPYSTPCAKDEPMATLQPGESLYSTFFLSAGKYGWVVSDPGHYEVSISLHTHGCKGGANLSSNVFGFAVAEPSRLNRQLRKQQEALAQDVFSDEVGRTLAFGGTRVLTGANDVLKELSERFPQSKGAKHADVALALPNVRDGYKVLNLNKDGSKSLGAVKADQQAGADAIKKVLLANGKEAAETMGNIAFQKVSDAAARDLKSQGDDSGSKEIRQNVLGTMKDSGVSLPEQVKKMLQEKANG